MTKRPHMQGSKRFIVAGLTEDCRLVVLVGCRTFTKKWNLCSIYFSYGLCYCKVYNEYAVHNLGAETNKKIPVSRL
jgi:hypothetical protein